MSATAGRRLLRRAPPQETLKTLIHHHRGLSSLSHSHHKHNHEYLAPDTYLNSWDPPSDPKLAQTKLALLRRDYAKKVREVRRGYAVEVEAMRAEKARKDAARREELRRENEERRKVRDVERKAKAAERAVEREEFRNMLLKERAEKLEYWRMREKNVEEKKKENKEILRRQSSLWVDESELEKKILEAIVDKASL